MSITIKQIYDLVKCLADYHDFDTDAAMKHLEKGTPINHIKVILGVVEKPTKATKVEEPEDEKITACRKNIALWQQKLDDGKVKDADKQREKIEKEEKKLAKLLEKMPKPKEEPEEVASKYGGAAHGSEPVKVEKKPAKAEPKEKRIKRFSPVMTIQLKTALEEVKVDISDKIKKEFQQYIEDLNDDDFRKEGLADHMRAFAKLKTPVVEKTSDDKEIVAVDLTELQGIGITATVEPTGTFWDADNGRFVTGPEADDDEDFEENKFEGKNYVVGEKTGRVYEARDTGDVFAGFIGVGKFKKMTK